MNDAEFLQIAEKNWSEKVTQNDKLGDISKPSFTKK